MYGQIGGTENHLPSPATLTALLPASTEEFVCLAVFASAKAIFMGPLVSLNRARNSCQKLPMDRSWEG